MAVRWYQDPDWDEATQADFRARLSRARGHRLFYLGQKATVIAEAHPDAALALLDEKIALARFEDEIVPALHAQAIIYFRQEKHGAMFAAFERAVELAGEFSASAAITDYCVAVGLLRDSARFGRALALLDDLETRSFNLRGHGATFGTLAARALICWQMGDRDSASVAATEALRLADSDNRAASQLSITASGPRSALHDRLLVIAGLWDEKRTGTPPDP